MGAIADEGKAALTPSQFNMWKQRKDTEAAAKAAEAARKREEDIAAGRVRMNGRELYKHEPSISSCWKGTCARAVSRYDAEGISLVVRFLLEPSGAEVALKAEALVVILESTIH